jgi:hypothetical protein
LGNFKTINENWAHPFPLWIHNLVMKPAVTLTHCITRWAGWSITKWVDVTCWRNKEERISVNALEENFCTGLQGHAQVRWAETELRTSRADIVLRGWLWHMLFP